MPFAEFFRRLGWAALIALAFAALYKFGDQMVDGLIGPFWRRELGLSKIEIGTITKAAGFAGVAVGGVLAAVLTPRLGTRRALIVFGLVQATTNLAYAGLAARGGGTAAIAAAVVLDQAANTMGTAAFMAVFAAMCDPGVSATQSALLTSLSSVGRRVFGWTGGALVVGHGWVAFFVATALIALPGVVLAARLPGAILDPPRRSGRPDRGRAADP
jgi:PAT family beta-lactamase induction signal transducer AmpG